MQLKFLIVTDPKNDWIEKKISSMKKLMELSPDITDVIFDVEYIQNLRPEVTSEGRVTSSWFQEKITRNGTLEGYLGAVFLCSHNDGKKWGLKSGLRGSYLRDGDEFMECWARGDEKDVVKFFDGTKRDKISKVIPHELGHGFQEFGYTNLEIHDFDYQNSINNIEGFYENFRVAPNKQTNIILQIFTLKRVLRTLLGIREGEYDIVPPVPSRYWNNPSQEYGVLNPEYPKTGRHIGLDLPCPIGTPIKARMNGRVSVVGYTDTLGNYCHFTFKKNGNKYTERYLHLSSKPNIGEYKQNQIFAISGSTGFSTGPHTHVETWYDDVDIEGINSENWNQKTVDPRLIK